jgi:ABC-2 type transport system permease protein
MSRRDDLLPNTAIIARREYRDRVRSRLYLVSTIILTVLALGVALAPTAVRALDRGSATRIGVVADASLTAGAVGIIDSILNTGAASSDPDVPRRFVVSIEQDRATAERLLDAGQLNAIFVVERSPGGGLAVTFRTDQLGDTVRNQLVGFAATGLGILDWTSRLPAGSDLGAFLPPTFELEGTNVATVGGRALGARELASRSFVGIVFVILLFITVIIYGMWVATGVAAEKSSRVMELMISAASPRQMLVGKVVGIGAAGLTQYVAIAIPALLVLVFQDRIAEAVLGPAWREGAPIVGLGLDMLVGYGVFFMLGFSLFALIYAAMGAFVSRPDDLQTLSLPLSLFAMAGYLMAVVTLGGGGGALTRIASFVPPFSPFVMLARSMVGRVEPWEIVVSVAILVLAIALVAAAAIRIYAAGVLLYGQRPGLRAFIAAARRVA